MGRRPVARLTTGVGVATIALSSVFAGTAWAPKVTTQPADPVECTIAPGWASVGDRGVDRCLLAARLAILQARIEALLARLEARANR
jgi:hypothetical protein